MKSFRFAIISVIFALIWSSVSVLARDSVTGVNADKKLEAAKIKFQTRLNMARKNLNSEFEHAIARIKNMPGLSEGARQDKLDRWVRAKRQFQSSYTFPAENEFAEMELTYFLAVNDAFRPVSKVVSDTIEKANKGNGVYLGLDGRDMKNQIEQELLGVNKFNSHTQWHGTFDRPGGTIPYHLSIGVKGEGGSFKGHVEDNPGVQGNWSYDVEGQMSGLAFEFVMTKSIRGGFQQVHVAGIVSGDRLIAKVTQRVGGKSSSGIVDLHRR